MMKSFLGVLSIYILIFIQPVPGEDKITIAVLELNPAGVSSVEAQIFSDRLRTDLFNTGNFIVLEREKVNEILSEQGFQTSGCTTNECAVEIGKLIGVQQMVAGNIGKLGELYTLNLRLIDVETGEVLRTATEDCRCPIETVLTQSLKNVSLLLAGESKDNLNRNNMPVETGTFGSEVEKEQVPIHKDIEYAASMIAIEKIKEGMQLLDNIIINSSDVILISQAQVVKLNYAERLIKEDEMDEAVLILDDVIKYNKTDSLTAKALYLKIVSDISDPEDVERLKIYYPNSPYTTAAINFLNRESYGEVHPFLYISCKSDFKGIFKVEILINGVSVKMDQSVIAPFWKIGSDYLYKFNADYTIEIISHNLRLPQSTSSNDVDKPAGIKSTFKLKSPEYYSGIRYLVLLFNISRDGKVTNCEFVKGQ